MKFFDDAKRKMGVLWREHKERVEARKALKAAGQSEHMHGRFFLLHVPATATILAAFVEVYWAILFCIEATGRLDANIETASGSGEPMSFLWNFAFSSHIPVLLGLAAATAPIVMISMVWLPVQFAMRGYGQWRRGTLIAVGLLANALVIVSGTVVMNSNRQAHLRDAMVVEQSADANRAMLTASVEDLRGELETLMNHRSTYVATAASVGAVAYERDYVAQARASNDPRLPLIERALGSARRADELRAQIIAARAQVAQAAPQAATQTSIEDTTGAGLNQFAEQVSVWRPPFVALVCTLIGVLGAWWTLAMLQGLNPRDVLRSGWADESHRIEDLRDQEPVAAEPMKPPREVVTDAETGEELIRITPKPHWRKQKGKKQRVETTPESLPDETGFSDKSRTAVTLAGEMELPAESAGDQGDGSNAEEETGDKQAGGETAEQVVEPGDEATHADDSSSSQPDLQDDSEAIAALQELELIDTPVLSTNQEEQNDQSNEDDQQSEHVESREEPETRESHMLPNVAAE